MPATSEKMTEITLKMPDALHRAIKAEAQAQGKSLGDIVVKTLTEHHEQEEYDCDDVNVDIAQGLYEAMLYEQGKIKLKDARESLNELN